MRAYRLSAISTALLGFCASIQAEESHDEFTAATDGLKVASAQPLWSEFSAESTLLPQAKAASLAHSRRLAEARGVNIETIDATMAANDTGPARKGNCQHLAVPGSLFMRERCFYESDAEEEFNRSQYRWEIQENIEQRQRDFLEIAEYSLAYRRQLKDQ